MDYQSHNIIRTKQVELELSEKKLVLCPLLLILFSTVKYLIKTGHQFIGRSDLMIWFMKIVNQQVIIQKYCKYLKIKYLMGNRKIIDKKSNL